MSSTTSKSSILTTTTTVGGGNWCHYNDQSYDLTQSCGFVPLLTSTVLLALEQYDDELQNITNNSNNNHHAVTAVNRNEVHRISLLGNGAFSNVYLVVTHNHHSGDRRHQPKLQRGGGGDACQKLAMKCINPAFMNGPDDLLTAAIDLANEAVILSSLPAHPNIIRLHGVSSDRFSQSFDTDGVDGDGYFLLLDCLTETLHDRLQRWRKDLARSDSSKWFPAATFLGRRKRCNNKRSDARTQLYGRIETVVTGIAHGMDHLHRHNVVLKDLKPANVGFDETTGAVRLFDFGMARRLEDCVGCDDICGSPRYMSPEALDGQGYSYRSDVYSFGVLLYEVCSLEVPFDDVNNTGRINTLDDFRKLIVDDEFRPSTMGIPCRDTRRLIEDCWDANVHKRPSFDDIIFRLQNIVESKEE
jgi:serine/threonine protein kinase